MARKKRGGGHYCKICGCIKSNESFSGKGHKNHICKKCAKLTPEKRNEMILIERISDIGCMKMFLNKKDKEALAKYVNGSSYSKRIRDYAASVLEEDEALKRRIREEEERQEESWELYPEIIDETEDSEEHMDTEFVDFTLISDDDLPF